MAKAKLYKVVINLPRYESHDTKRTHIISAKSESEAEQKAIESMANNVRCYKTLYLKTKEIKNVKK